VPNAVCLVKKGVYEILKPLRKRHKETLVAIEREIDIAEYAKEKVNKDIDGLLDMEKKRKMLVEVVDEARKVLRRVETIDGDKILNRRIEVLKRILHENIDEDEDGSGREKDRKDKPTNRLVSPVDPDARHGAKSKTKKFVGYKANVTETVESRFITNIVAMPGNEQDGKTMVRAVREQKRNGLVPTTVIGDTAYTDGLYRKKLRQSGTGVVAPLRVTNAKTRAIYPKSMFDYNEENQLLTCPQGVTTKKSYMDWNKGIIMYHFPMSECNNCPVQSKCTNDRYGRRTVGISFVNKELREAEAFNKTDEFKKVMKLRSPIEGKLAELVRYHGLRRARYRGLKRVGLQFYFTAAAVNLKRWFKILLEKTKPKLQETAFA
jgi:Transposase DDE domain